MVKVVIIGGGFSGLSVSAYLRKVRADAEIILIDKKRTFDFLPLLPDVVGRNIKPEHLYCNISDIGIRQKFTFINEEVCSVDFAEKEIKTNHRNIPYDYLVIASGSETNFYSNTAFKDFSYTLDCVKDAFTIRTLLVKNVFDNIVVCGGGYTGIELASNIRLFLTKHRRRARIILVERAAAILGSLPEWMKLYVAKNIKGLGIDIYTNTTIESVNKESVTISGNQVLRNSILVWAAGVKTHQFIQEISHKKNPQGRLEVDEYLRVNESCFATGDAALFNHNNKGYLRMAVQFALTQGACAGANIVRSINKGPLLSYRPLDLGYVVPMANDAACGKVLGVNVSGRLATSLHYLMCVYRLCAFRNKAGVFKDMLCGGGS